MADHVDPGNLDALLERLKRAGVTHFEGYGLKLAFLPSAVVAAQPRQEGRPDEAAPPASTTRPSAPPRSQDDLDAAVSRHVSRHSPRRLDQ